MRFKVTTPATADPVTYAEAVDHLIIDSGTDQDLIERHISAATEAIEAEHLIQTMKATITGYARSWSDCLRLGYRNPVLGISSIKYYDSSNAEQTLASSKYQLDNFGKVAYLDLQEMPSVYDRPDAIRVEFTAGYNGGTETEQRAAVPNRVKDAILLRVAALYEKREDAQLDLDKIRASDALLYMESRRYT